MSELQRPVTVLIAALGGEGGGVLTNWIVNAAADHDVDYLADGITESLIQRISRLPSLSVMARSTVLNLTNSAHT